MPRSLRTSSGSARSTRIFSPAPSADRTRQPQHDPTSSRDKSIGGGSLGEFAGARHARFAGSDRLDRGAGRSAFGETLIVSDYTLLCDHGARRASGVLRIPEAGLGAFSPLLARVEPFL